MVSLTPSQFCRAALHYRRGRRLDAPLTSLSLAKPAIYEADGEHPLQPAPEPPPAQPMMRRLGWNKLVLEPEHLADRVGDALSRIDAQYELAERRAPPRAAQPPIPPAVRRGLLFTRLASGESVVVSARSGDVVMRVLVSEEADGHYSISCARLSGDTFSYHAAFRQLKAALGEALTQHPLQSRGFVTPPTGAARGALPLARALPALTAP